MVIVANVQNNADEPINAMFVIQAKNQYGFTEQVSFLNSTVAANGEVQIGVDWSPQMSGNYVIDVFAIDDADSPRVLSEKVSSLVGTVPASTLKTIPEGAYTDDANYSPSSVTVVVGYNNTIAWVNRDSHPHKVRADNIDDPGFAMIVRRMGSLDTDQFFSYTFTEPGTYGYHENAMKGKIIVLPDPYEGYEKDRGERHTDIQLEIYGSYDPMFAGHFLKGYVRDSAGRPIADGNVDVYANNMHMGNATSDVEGCFNFKDWKVDPLQDDRDFALKDGKPWLDLAIVARYSGDDYHFWSQETTSSMLYFQWPPVAPAQYEMTMSTGNNTVSVVQGGTTDFDVSVRPYSKEHETDQLFLNLQRLPCAVQATVSSQDGRAAVDDPGNYTISITAEEYAEPGRYFIQIQQDLSNADNLYVRDPAIGGFWLEILPKR